MQKLAVIAGVCFLSLSAIADAVKPADKAEEVIVTATRTEHQVKDISGNATVIGPQEISESNARTADEALRYVSGIDIQGGGFFGSKIRLSMRGVPSNYGPQRVLVMLDNRPINEEYQGDVDFRFLPAENIERIEIVRGPGSALYGSNAVGGVINLISKSGTEQPLFKLASTSGSFNTYGTILQHGHKINNLDYFISAGQQTTDGFINNADSTPKDWSAQNLAARANWQINDESSASLSLGLNNGTGSDEQFVLDQSNNYLNLSLQTKLFKEYDGVFSARVYRNGLEQDRAWKFGFTGVYEQSTLGAQIQQSLQPAKNHLVTFGVDTKQQNVLVKETGGIIDETVNSQAVYVQDEIGLSEGPNGKRVIGTVGLRYDQHEEFGGKVSPRLGLVYRLNEQTALRGSAGQGYREPSVSDLFLPLTPYGGVITFQGNANVKPETMMSYELGLDHRFAGGLSTRLTVYYSQFQDAFDYIKDPDDINRPHNFSRMAIQGIESEARWQISEQLGGFVNYTYTDARYQKDKNNPALKGNFVDEVPRNLGNIGIRYQPAKSPTVLNFKVSAMGERYTDPENSRANKLMKYLVAQVGVQSTLNQNSSFFVTAHNLFNRSYKETIEYEQPGRWFETGLSIEF
jgi:outer membrane receptor for ferrienterochelin and colicins